MANPSLPAPRPSAKTRLRRIEALRPTNSHELFRFIEFVIDIAVPRSPLIEGHHAPLEYLRSTFFEPCDESRPTTSYQEAPLPLALETSHDHPVTQPPDRCGDLVVWANRGGGKTMLGAVATLLDLLFKPGIQVRILGGSFEQSSKMYRYLLGLLHQPLLDGLTACQPTQRRIELVNSSVVEILPQSEKSVRGLHVHKLRCDEVELFKPQVWEAAQMAVRSGRCGPIEVHGRIEAISTMHRPFGLMSRLVSRVTSTNQPNPSATAHHGVLRWCALDVIERCPEHRDCNPCPLWNDCQGRAKQAEGFVKIDDLIAQKARVSQETWNSEILCRRPRRSDSVYPRFEPYPAHQARLTPAPSDPHTTTVIKPTKTPDTMTGPSLASSTSPTWPPDATTPPSNPLDQKLHPASRLGTTTLDTTLNTTLNTPQGHILTDSPDLPKPKRTTDDHLTPASHLPRDTHNTATPKKPLRYPSIDIPKGTSGGLWVGGMDFGLRSPLVMLWARVRPLSAKDSPLNQVDRNVQAKSLIATERTHHANLTPRQVQTGSNTLDHRVEILDEYIQTDLTLDQHLEVIAARGWPKVQWLGVDPAGGQRNAQTGLTDIQVLRRAGYSVHSQRVSVREGIEAVRRRFDHRLLFIHPRCTQLIEALVQYHFDPDRPHDDSPVKDGPDHLCDALRYLVVNLDRHTATPVAVRSYW